MATTPRRRVNHPPKPRNESAVERLYLELRDRAMRYDFRPGARINEQALGRELGISRAPLREALNRLVAEGWLEFVMNKGFFRKSISVNEVYDLYQVRIALERLAVTLGLEHATDQEIHALQAYWRGIIHNAAHMSLGDLLLADEEFHRRLTAFARNQELSTFMDAIARRIHIARYIDMQQSAWNAKAFDAHIELLEHMLARQKDAAIACITAHIDMSLKRAVKITKEMVAKFFLEGTSPHALAAEDRHAAAAIAAKIAGGVMPVRPVSDWSLGD